MRVWRFGVARAAVRLRALSHRTCRKGIRLIFLNPATEIARLRRVGFTAGTYEATQCGNANELRYAV